MITKDTKNKAAVYNTHSYSLSSSSHS